MSTNNLPTQYDQQAIDYANSPKAVGYISSAWFEFEQRSILRWLGYDQPQTIVPHQILDVGCGVGLFSQPLTSHHSVIGLDISPAQLQQAQQKGIKPITGSGFKAPFLSHHFDKVFLIEVIQHFEFQHGLDLITELTRLVAPGGEIIIVARNHYSLVRKISAPTLRLIGRQQFQLYGYQPAQLGKLLTKLHFCNIQTAFIFPPVNYFQVNDGATSIAKYIGSSFVIKGKKQR